MADAGASIRAFTTVFGAWRCRKNDQEQIERPSRDTESYRETNVDTQIFKTDSKRNKRTNIQEKNFRKIYSFFEPSRLCTVRQKKYRAQKNRTFLVKSVYCKLLVSRCYLIVVEDRSQHILLVYASHVLKKHEISSRLWACGLRTLSMCFHEAIARHECYYETSCSNKSLHFLFKITFTRDFCCE
jgi:hypothetical protein